VQPGEDRFLPGVDVDVDALQETVLAWLHRTVAGFGRWQRLLAELDRQSGTDLAMLSVAVRSLALLDASEAVAA
jgi:NAD-specific glutamate dehydrogenase